MNRFKPPIIKNKNAISVCYYSHFEPIIYGEGEGYEADILKAVFKLWDMPFKFHPCSDYKDIWLKAGETHSTFDIVAAGLDPNCHASEKKIVYSIPTTEYSQSLLIKRKFFNNKKIVGYTSFNNNDMKIGVLGNTSGEKYGLERAKKLGLSSSIFTRYDTEEDLKNALLSEEIFAIARGTIGNEFQESKNKDLMTIEKQSFGEVMAYSIDPDNDNLHEALNVAIKALTNSGAISYAEWFKNPNVFSDISF